MAAGLGFKTFTTGEVLTAADTNGYLMQGVLVFASSAARAAAITSPQEGQYSYLKDTNSTEYYDGAAWIAAPIGDITGVTAGTGISGGGTSGTVTITNSMATEITAKGDLIAGTGSATFDNLPVGTNGQTLVADSSTATGLKWATASSGALTFISATTMSGVASQAVNPFSTTYENYLVLIQLNGGGNNATTKWQFRNGATNRTTAYYAGAQQIGYQGTTANYNVNNGSSVEMVGNVGGTQGGLIVINVTNVNNAGQPAITGTSVQGLYQYYFGGIRDSVETNDGFLITSSNSMTGSIRVYGIQKS